MSGTPNILIVLSGYSKSGVGEQFLKAMLSGYNNEQVWRYSTVVHSQVEEVPFRTVLRKVSYHRYPVMSAMALSRFQKKELELCVKDINTILEQQQIDVVWIFLNSWYTIQIASRLVEHISVPMVTHVWDAPEYIASNLMAPSSYSKGLMKAFSSAMSHATVGVTVSKGMSAEYLARYGLSCRDMVYCPPKTSWQKPQDHKRDYVKIVFAGSLYAYGQWNAFLDAVEYNNKQTESRRIAVTCIGNVSRWARPRKWVRYEPLKPAHEAAKAVNEADIAYLPYWTTKKHAYFVKMAFPGKLSFYTVAGTPILFHGPRDSTPTEFLQRHPVGVSCHSNDATKLLDTISLLLSDDFRTGYKTAREMAIEQVFHPQRCVDIFHETLSTAMGSSIVSIK